MNAKRVLKIDLNPWHNASRDMRELSLYEELGADVEVLAKGDVDDRGRIDYVKGFKVHRYTTRPLGQKVPRLINRIISVFSWASFVRKKLKPDIISGHDLPGVAVAWLSNSFLKKTKRAKIIYDSHEFELGRNEKRSAFTSWLVRQAESFFIKRCVFTIAVNDSIADRLVEEYRLKDRPVVVRSTPDKWVLDEKIISQNRNRIITKLGVDCLVTYHGIIRSGRGIEEIIEILKHDDSLGALVVGDSASKEYYDGLIKLAQDMGVQERVEFHNAVPLETLSTLIGAGDISLILIKPESESYYLSLPNKFFETIQALTPLIASDLPEMSKLTKQYGIGLLCNPEDIDDVCSKIKMLREDSNLYQDIKKNLLTAKEELCWEKEKSKLASAVIPLL